MVETLRENHITSKSATDKRERLTAKGQTLEVKTRNGEK
jgi:hypothetical protein